MNKKYILLDGTSSAGKSSICNFFGKKKYICFQADKYYYDPKINEQFITISNKYGERYKLFNNLPIKYMVDDALKLKCNCIFDTITQKEIIKYMKSLKKNLFIINVFTNIPDIARNLDSRRKEGDLRGKGAFKDFSNRYIKTSNNNINKIETVNRQQFKNILLQNFKYEFENKKDLIKFANNIFKTMNIIDDKDHYIKLRDNFICNYLLITTNKSKEDIFKELKKIL
jgi:hypothetical protein